MIIYFNNKFSNNKNILIDVRDRGFLLGDAIFETILFNNQKIILPKTIIQMTTYLEFSLYFWKCLHYFVEHNKIFTPPLKDGALDGTVRKLLLKKKKVAVKSISLNNLKRISEVFLTNSILGVRPVTKIDKISFDFGPKTKTIMKYSESLGI